MNKNMAQQMNNFNSQFQADRDSFSQWKRSMAQGGQQQMGRPPSGQPIQFDQSIQQGQVKYQPVNLQGMQGGGEPNPYSYGANPAMSQWNRGQQHPPNAQYTSGDGNISYDQYGNQLDSLGNVAYGGGGGGGGGQQQQNPWPGWTQNTWQSSGEGGERNPFTEVQYAPGMMPTNFNDYMNASPEDQAKLANWMNLYLTSQAQGWNIHQQQNMNQLELDKFAHQATLDQWGHQFADRQQGYNELQGDRNYKLAVGQQALDKQMAERGMSVTERKQTMDEMNSTFNREMTREQFDQSVKEFAAKFGLEEFQVKSQVEMQRQKLALDEWETKARMGLEGEALELEKKKVADKWGIDTRALDIEQQKVGNQQAQFKDTLKLQYDQMAQSGQQFGQQMALEHLKLGTNQEQFKQTLAEQARQANQNIKFQYDDLQERAKQVAAQQGLQLKEIENTAWYQQQMAGIQQYQAHTQRQLGEAQQAFQYYESQQQQRQFGETLGYQREIDAARLAEQRRANNLAAFGRAQEVNRRWLRR